MMSKKKWLCEARLYLILDAQVNRYQQLLDLLKKSVGCGVDIVQLRDKFGCAKDILAFTKQAKQIIRGRIPLIINDRVDLARIADADGVHLGQKDISLADARGMLGSKKIIGISCQTMAHVKKAQNEGADYIGFGSVFKTLTKPERVPMELDLLKKVLCVSEIPLFAIGGINRSNVGLITRLGVRRVAVCRDVCCANDVRNAIVQFKQRIVDL